jgi:hypothetical protein
MPINDLWRKRSLSSTTFSAVWYSVNKKVSPPCSAHLLVSLYRTKGSELSRY